MTLPSTVTSPAPCILLLRAKKYPCLFLLFNYKETRTTAGAPHGKKNPLSTLGSLPQVLFAHLEENRDLLSLLSISLTFFSSAQGSPGLQPQRPLSGSRPGRPQLPAPAPLPSVSGSPPPIATIATCADVRRRGGERERGTLRRSGRRGKRAEDPLRETPPQPGSLLTTPAGGGGEGGDAADAGPGREEDGRRGDGTGHDRTGQALPSTAPRPFPSPSRSRSLRRRRPSLLPPPLKIPRPPFCGGAAARPGLCGEAAMARGAPQGLLSPSSSLLPLVLSSPYCFEACVCGPACTHSQLRPWVWQCGGPKPVLQLSELVRHALGSSPAVFGNLKCQSTYCYRRAADRPVEGSSELYNSGKWGLAMTHHKEMSSCEHFVTSGLRSTS